MIMNASNITLQQLYIIMKSMHVNRKKHKHKFFLLQYHTSCPTSSRQIHRYADKYLCAHGPNFQQSPTGPTESMFGLIHFPAQIAQRPRMLLSLSLLLLLMFRIPFNLEDLFLAKYVLISQMVSLVFLSLL